MTQVSVFNFNQNEVRTVVRDDGEIWFVASDVCKALEISNTSDALRRLDVDEVTIVSIEGRTPTGGVVKKPTNAVNESGLYSLVLGSRKPEAKQFKKWVTSEVLPSIRKNGGYIVGQEVDSPEILMAKALQVANNILESKTKELEAATAKVELLEPKANALDTLANAEGTVTLDQAAKLLGVQPKKFLNPWLENNGWCFRRSGELNPHQDKINKKYMIAVYRTYQGNGGEQHTRVQTRITSLGMTHLTSELQKWQSKQNIGNVA